MKTELETPVTLKDTNRTRFGVVIEIKEHRARIQWQAVRFGETDEYTHRDTKRTWVRLDTLQPWALEDRVRLKEGRTLTADGMEYTTPKT